MLPESKRCAQDGVLEFVLTVVEERCLPVDCATAKKSELVDQNWSDNNNSELRRTEFSSYDFDHGFALISVDLRSCAPLVHRFGGVFSGTSHTRMAFVRDRAVLEHIPHLTFGGIHPSTNEALHLGFVWLAPFLRWHRDEYDPRDIVHHDLGLFVVSIRRVLVEGLEKFPVQTHEDR